MFINGNKLNYSFEDYVNNIDLHQVIGYRDLYGGKICIEGGKAYIRSWHTGRKNLKSLKNSQNVTLEFINEVFVI